VEKNINKFCGHDMSNFVDENTGCVQNIIKMCGQNVNTLFGQIISTLCGQNINTLRVQNLNIFRGKT
jgi:hypothetical protein